MRSAFQPGMLIACHRVGSGEQSPVGIEGGREEEEEEMKRRKKRRKQEKR